MPRKFVPCEEQGCDRAGHHRGCTTNRRLCHGHWMREAGLIDPNKPLQHQNAGKKCKVANCLLDAKFKGLCSTHWARQHHGKGIPLSAPIRKGGMKLGCITAVRLSAFSAIALKRRAEASGVPISSLIRALVDRWAMTEGADITHHPLGT